MVTEAEDYFSKWGDSGEVDLKYELEHLIILTAMLSSLTCLSLLTVVVIELERSLRKSLQVSFLLAKVLASPKNDMLQCFIEYKYKDGCPTTEAEVTGLLIAALFAGQHTSSITSTWTGAYLLRHKESLSAVVDEQKVARNNLYKSMEPRLIMMFYLRWTSCIDALRKP
ncbi:hypothetical protein V6N11_067391 [Hibiscus sabdariffa]|uniref:Uncharacterized protein n=1 Tax=Hibiscus sabdariffa TaxID=183260 RepID=A0ABR2SRK1_9ROSI